MHMAINQVPEKVTTKTLMKMKGQVPISVLTAYDYSSALIIDDAGIDVVLVGDSASNVMGGHRTTLPITLDQMIWHASSVVRAVRRALVVVDMPFGSYEIDPTLAFQSAVRVIKESGAQAVKMERGREVLESIRAVTNAGIPVMGHLGLTPQSIHQLGSYRTRGEDKAAGEAMLEDALLLEEAGCFSMVVEKVPKELAMQLSQKLKIPIIGIGAGPWVDGQVLVMQDMLGITRSKMPRFVRRYARLHDTILEAVKEYISDVKNGNFPDKDTESY